MSATITNRFELRPHVSVGEWSDRKGGWAIWDLIEDKQTGWYLHRSQAEQRVAEMNADAAKEGAAA